MQRVPFIAGGAALLVALCASSAFAQQTANWYDQNPPKTRADVKADTVEWLNAGYNPLARRYYPENALAADKIVATRRAAAATRTPAR
jgi:hypothetical protein